MPNRASNFCQNPLFRLLDKELTANFPMPEGWDWIGSILPESSKPVMHGRHRKWASQKGHLRWSPHRELLVVIRGEAVYHYAGACYWRKPGTVLVMNRHEARDMLPASHKTSICCLWINLLDPQSMTFHVNEADRHGRTTRLVAPQSVPAAWAFELDAAWNYLEAHRQHVGGTIWFKSVVQTLVFHILRTEPVAPRPVGGYSVIPGMQSYMREHLSEPLSLATLAQVSGYSSSFFHRHFHRETGMTPLQYLNLLRLEKAKSLLESGWTVAATCEAIGIESASYFHKLFKRSFGVTPAAWTAKRLPARRSQLAAP